MRPEVDGVELVAWARSERARIESWLTEHRALLFRGFGPCTVEEFEAFVAATSDSEPLAYVDRTTPRTTLGTKIYTSTVHPADQSIRLHNEGTYWVRWAQKLYFCCRTAAESGGETPIADVGRVYQRIDPAIRDRFLERQMMLVRNFHPGVGLPWQEVFQTSERREVEAYCDQNAIEYEWRDGEQLRTRQVRPAVRKHPRTGEPVWFNHAAFFHHTSLSPIVREALVAQFGLEGLPHNTYFGDGGAIEPEVAEHLRQAYLAEREMFPWQPGDIMLVDNMAVAHARQPFVGAREVIVAMTDPIDDARTRWEPAA